MRRLAGFLIVLSTLTAQPQQQTQQPLQTLQARARAVLLDVVVTDRKGNTIEGLKQQDFQVLEDNQPQTTKSFEEHRAPTTAPPPAPPLPPNTFTNRPQPGDGGPSVVILLDALNTPIADQQYVRQQLISYLKDMRPGTSVAIFALGAQLRLIQGFTRDPQVLLRAVKDRDDQFLTAIPQGFEYVAQRTRMDLLRDALKGLGIYLATQPGRKSLVWFTARIPSYLYQDGSGTGGALADREDFLFDYTPATDALLLGRVNIYPVDSRSVRTDPRFSAANRDLPNIQQISNFGTADALEHEQLEDVARATGGHAFFNTNSIRQVMTDIVNRGQNFYTLSYTPANKNWDGGYRKLKVQLEQTLAQQGYQMQYREGYYARRDSLALRKEIKAGTTAKASGSAPLRTPDGRLQITDHSAPPPFEELMHLGVVDPGQLYFEAQVKPATEVEKLAKQEPLPPNNYLDPHYKDKPFRNHVITFNVPADQVKLALAPDGGYHGRLEFVALVTDEKGTLVNSLQETIVMDMQPASYATAVAGGLAMPMQVAVPTKGRFFLRMGVHDLESNKGGAVETSMGEVQPLP